ncbi:hypothetical protein ACQP25_21955 [Microtetraspora malaysiensis]|uniref:hypothetical protein n=1 Tax=Microtetraspora malaysiensis TaxID=161358 RepID=UPI003D8FA852
MHEWTESPGSSPGSPRDPIPEPPPSAPSRGLPAEPVRAADADPFAMMPPELHGIRHGIPDPPGPQIVRDVLLASALGGMPASPRGTAPEADPAPIRYRLRPLARSALRPLVRAWTLLAMESRIMRRSIWVVSALVMAVSVGFALAEGRSAQLVLSLAAPLIAGVGVAGSYDLGRDGGDTAAELVLTSPTSPRVIVLARVTLAFGYDLGLALLSSSVALYYGSVPESMTALVTAWLGPMALLAALGLLLAVIWHAEGAIGVAAAVWMAYALSVIDLLPLDGMRAFWANGPVTLALALVLVTAALIAAGRGEPIRFGGATHRS